MANTDIEATISELRRRRNGLGYGDLVKLMERAGCIVKPTQEGCLVRHPEVRGYMATVARPHGRAAGNKVKEPYVKNCIRLLEDVQEG